MSYHSYSSYGTPVNRKSSYPMFPSPSTEASPPPAYVNGYFTSEPSSYSCDGHHNTRSPPKVDSGYVGGFYAPQHNTSHHTNSGVEKGYSCPAPLRSNPPSYGSQPGYQFTSTRSTYPAAPGALPPNYSNPPSYPPSSAPSLASTSSSSDSGITADDVRPGDLKFEVIKWGIVEMTTCKEIFASWVKELDQCKNKHITPLEQNLIDCVYELHDESESALESSHLVLDSYRSFARCMDRNLRKLSQEGGQLYASSDLQKLGSEVSTQSEALSKHVATMQEKLIDLVNMLDTTKRDASKHKLWKKVWGWLVKAFKILAAVLTASAVIAPFVHPIGVGASVVMGGLTTLTSSAAAICEEFRKHASQELIFDNIVDLLRYKVPESAKKAELALSTFQTCQHVLRVGMEVQNGRNGWMDAKEASEAANEWAHASDELHKFVEVPTRASTI
ncbi:hypothetical protein SCHPADRAFT_333971 [Schizopora paradoxa]|uniref:Uncharacterized protein n=1 Tax=Schizopora paradoxa TaxID=27342 RepID=A0A0H2RQ62_9AGAM|nr:hypothetical protein SCHPADRAFT_333971 [Schizopora paradoxa]